MPFQDPPAKSLTLPDGNPALPGFDTLQIGSDLPAELKAYGYSAAFVFYHQSFDYSSTLGQVKYYFVAVYHAPNLNAGAIPSAVDIGFVWVANPFANSTGQVKIAMNMFHDKAGNTVNSGVGGGIAGALVSLGNRLLVDTDNGILEFRSNDLAYPRVGMISFAGGWYNNSGDTYFWAKKTAVGTIHIQGLLRNVAATPGDSTVCFLPYNTYAPIQGDVFIPILANGNLNWLKVQPSGRISVTAAISGTASFVVSGSWVTSPR